MNPLGNTHGTVPARLAVGIISAGRVGTAVGEALERVGHVVSAVSAVSNASLARARTRLPGAVVLPPPDVAQRCELLLLAVPDDALAGLVKGLAATGAVKPGTLVAHTSGANGVGVLAPLTAQGATPLAIHPAMTFLGTAEDTARLRGACFGVTAADEVGYAVAAALVLEVGGEPVRVREDSRALYHAALAHGANHLVTLVVDAVAALRHALDGQELPGQEPVTDASAGRVLAPLVTAALDNALRRGKAALTGPVARGDHAAVARHLQSLAEMDPDIAAGYRALSLRTAQNAGAGPEVLAVLADPAATSTPDAPTSASPKEEK